MSQAPKLPNPFDPVEEAPKPNQPDLLEEKQISQMVNEGGREPPLPDAPPTKRDPLIVEVPTVLSRIQNMLKLEGALHTALESLQRLNEGEPAPKVIVRIDENDDNHISAYWEKPKK